jgi:hypothetical protein
MKKILVLSLLMLFTFGLAACDLDGNTDDIDDIVCEEDETLVDGECVPEEDDTPADTTAPVLTGVEDVEIFVEANFNALDGVTATDDTDGDITSNITVTGTVDTSKTGTYFLRYSIEDAAGNISEDTRYVTVVVDPSLIGDEMVPNGDFSLGWAIWQTTTGLEGGTANYSVVDEELVVEITGVSGGMWEPRLENRGITFEEGKIYEVSFDARALAPRAIHVQVGELLDAAPYFDDFHETKLEIFDLTTTMETYSFIFAMTEPTNDNGSLNFEMGTIEGTVGTDNLLTTVYLDNVVITEVDPNTVEDTEKPVINGINNKNIDQGSTFDPLEGVTVIDNIDGEITLTASNVTGTVDTATLGEYELTYTVSDAAGNEATETRTITVVEPSEDPEYPAVGWRAYLNDWEGTSGEMLVKDGELVLDLFGINAYAPWTIQIIQDAFALGTGEDNVGSFLLESETTYKVTFDAKASIAGDINVLFGYGGGEEWTQYIAETVSVTTTMDTHTFEFTTDATTDYSVESQFKLELGNLFNGQTAPQSFTLDNVVIEKQNASEEFVDAELIINGDMTEVVGPEPAVGWRTFLNGSVGELLSDNGELVLSLSEITSSASWHVQVIQDAFALGTGDDNVGSFLLESETTYKVTFDAKASVAGDVSVLFGHAGGGWTQYYGETVALTTDMTTHTFEFTTDATTDYSVPSQFKIEMGLLFAGLDAPQSFTLDNVVIEKENASEEFVDADLIVNGDMSEIVSSEEPTLAQLTTPFGVEINGTTLAWGALPEADGFKVYIEGFATSPVVISAEIYSLDLSTISLDAGTYNIQVQAVGDDTAYLDSDLSTAVSYTVS